MECRDAKQLIMERLDGELPAEENVRLEEHLAACDACTRELAQQRRLIDGIKALPRVPAPADLAQRVNATIARETVRRPGRGAWVRRYGAMAASIAIVVVAATLWLKDNKAPQRSAAPAPTKRLKDEPTYAEKPRGGMDASKTAEEEFLDDLAAQPLAESPGLAPAKEMKQTKTLAKGKAFDEMPEAEGLEDDDATDRRLFDVVVEADSAEQCLDDLVAFLEERGVDVIARISSRRSVILAQIGEPDRAPDRAADDVRSGIIAQIAASGKFRLVRPGAPHDAVVADAEGKAPGRARSQPPAPLETGAVAPSRGVLAILVVRPAASNRPPAAEAQTKEAAQ